MASELTASNPLLQRWAAPFGLPPFAAIQAAHFAPAFDVAMAERLREIDAIADQPAAPSFDNTVAALDRAGVLFDRIGGVFHNLSSSETSAELQAVERELAPRLAAHASAVYMNARLFARIDGLHRERQALGLPADALRLLERFHLDFVRAGAGLAPAAQAHYAMLMQQLAALMTQFSQNVLADESSFQLRLQGDADLAGLPDFVRAAAREAARERGLEGDEDDAAHLITLSRSLIVPFLTFSDRRDLREAAWRGWTTRGEHAGAHDNRPVARQILALRHQQAQLHGHVCYADYALADTMAGTRGAVHALLMQVWAPAKGRAEQERAALQAMAVRHGETAPIEAWDWRYQAERVRRERYGLDEAQLKPYFSLERMTEAAFDCAGRLFGLRFVPRPDLPAYHPDVDVYEVRRGTAQGASGAGSDEVIGIFLHDNFARPSKRSGAWMSAYRKQAYDGAERVLPIIVNNNNFAKAAAGAPTLLSADDARTLFHEFGHGLHGLLSDVRFERLAGTAVLRDFVELPSQLFEHWLAEPAVLKRHARHHATGEPIPDALVAQLKAAEHFNQGYETLRYTASALVDLAVHSRPDGAPDDIAAFEADELQRVGLPPGIGVNHRLPHFQHLFAGTSYAAGYYVYLWAEVLDADGFDAFVEAGDPFDAAVAARLLRHVYAAGNAVEPMAAYRAFRGRAPTVVPMLRDRGLRQPAAT